MKKILIILLAGILFSACSDSWLETEPTEKISVENAFSTEKSIKAAVNGVYYVMQSSHAYGRFLTMMQEVRGDDMILEENYNWRRFKNEYNYAYYPASSNGNSIYLKLYEVIEACNSITDAEKAGKISLPDATKNKYLAEVRAARALAYFHLVRLFAKPYILDNDAPGVPLKLDSDAGVNEGRAKSSVVYGQIIDDLLFSEKYSTPTGGQGGNAKITKAFVRGLLGRVYMTMGNYSEALGWTDKAIEDAPTYSSDYSVGMTEGMSESIFEIQYTENTFLQYGSLQSFYDFGYLDGGGYGTIGCSDDFYAQYAPNDNRVKSWFYTQWAYSNQKHYYDGANKTTFYDFMQSAIANPADYVGTIPSSITEDGVITPEEVNKLVRKNWVRSGFRTHYSLYGKFPRKGADFVGYTANPEGSTGVMNLGHVPIMRTSELILMKAELEHRNSQDGKAQIELNKIRTRAGVATTSATGTALLDEILLERRKELIGEGFRMYDILRLQKPVTRSNYWGDAKYKVLDPTNPGKMILPIPKKEIDANDKLTEADQNEAYL